MAKRKIKNNISDNLGFLVSEFENESTYHDFLDRMATICMNMFEYENLPDSMDARYLERCLFFDGKAAMLKDSNYGYINTRAATNGYINIYGLPTSIHCYSEGEVFSSDRAVYSGINDSDDENKYCVLVRNNWNDIPTAFKIQLFAERLYRTQRVIDININAQKTPILLVGSESQKLTLENLYSQYDGNKPAILGDEDLITNESLKSINTQAPYVADKLQEYKKEIWNEFLTTIGINTIDVEKKERLISGESNANNELINMNLQSYLVPRKKACEEFNKLYGTNIQVKLRSDLANLIKQNESIVRDYNNNGVIDSEDIEREVDLNE
jgi:hypothetical protein